MASDVLPLTSWQLDGMLFGLDVDDYSLNMTFDLRGHVDIDRLRRALVALSPRHEALRCRIVGDEVPMQRIESVAAGVADRGVLVELDASGDDEEQIVQRMTAATVKAAAAPGVALRAAICAVEPGRWLLHLQVHHFFVDGYASVLLVEELWSAYASGGGVEQPAPSYRDVVEREVAAILSPPERARAHWNRLIDDLRAAGQLPVSAVTRGSEPSAGAVVTERTWSGEDGRRLRHGARTLGVTTATLALECARRAVAFALEPASWFVALTPVAGAARDRRLRLVIAATITICPIAYRHDEADRSLGQGAQLAMNASMAAAQHSVLPPLVAARGRALDLANRAAADRRVPASRTT